MIKRCSAIAAAALTAVVTMLAVLAGHAEATIQGLSGTTFNLTAGTGHIFTGEGNSVFIWGYGESTGTVQYPGPTLIVNQDQVITITLTNQLPVPTSLVFPGQIGVQATGGSPGMLTREAAPGGADTVTYTFKATHAGTYMYHSGTELDLQVEMGLFGALIVRPAGFVQAAPKAYGHINTSYDNEYLFLLSEMDHRIHQLVEFGRMAEINTNDFHPVYWFVNGRNFPDTILDQGVNWLPTQPYNSFPMMHPGDKLLLRVIGAGRDLHPFHVHGNNALVIARNGRVLTSTPDAVNPEPDLARSEYTITSIPGETVDAYFEWTGKDLGWDIYGTAADGLTHDCVDSTCTDTSPSDGFNDADSRPCIDDVSKEYCPAHGKPFPVALPNQLAVVFGEAYSGSPFLGSAEPLPPDHVSINPYGAFMFPWHSHHEKEIINNDIFVGGMFSVLYILPHGVGIPF